MRLNSWRLTQNIALSFVLSTSLCALATAQVPLETPPPHLAAAAALAPAASSLEKRVPDANPADPLGGTNLNRLRDGMNRGRTDLENAYRLCVQRVRFATDGAGGVATPVDHKDDYYNPQIAANCSLNAAERAILFNQQESFLQYGNELEVCAVDSVDGKDDDECGGNPGAPGCIGASGALGAVVKAVADPPGCDPDVPTIPPCVFIYDGIPAAVWLDAAENHLVGGNHCIDKRLIPEVSDPSVVQKRTNLAMLGTDTYNLVGPPVAQPLVASPDRPRPAVPVVLVPGNPVFVVARPEISASGASRAPVDGKGASAIPPSRGLRVDITESGESVKSIHEKFLEMFDEEQKFIGDDGSKHFGLANGELMTRVGKGESLRDILRDSPFAKKLPAKELAGRFAEPEAGESNDPRAESIIARAAPPRPETVVESSGTSRGVGTPASSAGSGAVALLAPTETRIDAGRAPAARPPAPTLYRELTIFERARRQYKARTEELLTTDYHLRALNPKGNGISQSSPFKVE